MARSHSIHMITDMTRNVQAAFTVKHEAARYLVDFKQKYGIQYLMVQSVRDGARINHHDSPFVKAEDWLERYKA